MASTLRSSSSRRETSMENQQSKKIGCMSGIFHLLQSHHHSRKRLTSAGKKNKSVDSPRKPKPSAGIPGDGRETTPVKPPGSPNIRRDWRRLSCDVPRSPTLSAEIRRSNSVNSPTNFRRQPALVARLMGLEELPMEEPEESMADKRRKILGALEKCDQDLKALKKIIEAVQAAEDGRRAPPAATVVVLPISAREATGAGQIRRSPEKEEKELRVEKKCSDLDGEQQPSPVSVLDGISSPLKKARERSEQGGQFKKLKDDELSGSFFSKVLINQLPRLPSGHKRDDGPFKYTSSTVKMMKHRAPFRGSKALMEAVNEVWMDAIWRERWEFGRLGVVLEGDIFGELLEEIVREMGFHGKRSLPFENCRKRLWF